MLGVIVEDVAYVWENDLLENVLFEVFQEPAANGFMKHLQIRAPAASGTPFFSVSLVV